MPEAEVLWRVLCRSSKLFSMFFCIFWPQSKALDPKLNCGSIFHIPVPPKKKLLVIPGHHMDQVYRKCLEEFIITYVTGEFFELFEENTPRTSRDVLLIIAVLLQTFSLRTFYRKFPSTEAFLLGSFLKKRRLMQNFSLMCTMCRIRESQMFLFNLFQMFQKQPFYLEKAQQISC